MPRPNPPPGIFGHDRTRVTPHYAVMPPQGILESRLPGWKDTLVRFQTSPAMGAAFAQALLEIAEGGGTAGAVRDGLEHFFYVVSGQIHMSAGSLQSVLGPGGYGYVPAGTAMQMTAADASRVIWIKRPYETVAGYEPPPPMFGMRNDVPRVNKHTEGRYWQHLLPPGDMAFDLEVNILGFAPGNYFPFVETHIMEHGLYMLEGQGLYLLGGEWHECWTDDFIWMGPYCPQQFYCTGWEGAAYLLYKNVNRDVRFP